MKTINVVGIGIAGISTMVAIAVRGQTGTTASSTGPTAEAVVDATGNLHVPDAYRATYQSLGSWAVAATVGNQARPGHAMRPLRRHRAFAAKLEKRHRKWPRRLRAPSRLQHAVCGIAWTCSRDSTPSKVTGAQRCASDTWESWP